MPRPLIGWRKYLRWRPAPDSRTERRRARAEIRHAETLTVRRLSPGELHPACCPGTVIVDHDGIGPGPLLIEHHRRAHGLPIAWHTDTPTPDVGG